MSTGSIVPTLNDQSVYGGVVVNPDGSNIGEQPYSAEVYAADETDHDVVYLCQAAPGTALDAPKWRISRTATHKTTGAVSIRYAGGTAEFSNAATNLATVQAHAYS